MADTMEETGITKALDAAQHELEYATKDDVLTAYKTMKARTADLSLSFSVREAAFRNLLMLRGMLKEY